MTGTEMEGEKVKTCDFLSLNGKFIFNNSTSARSAKLAIITSYPTSASGIIIISNIVLLKNAHKISRILPDFIYKNNQYQFSACF